MECEIQMNLDILIPEKTTKNKSPEDKKKVLTNNGQTTEVW